MNPPGLWMIATAPVLVALFIVVMRWATNPDPRAAEDWREIDDRIDRKV